ncbi:non-ribosomal peptide synthetase [Aquimarina spongiae]|uniref:Non-ribosomal peptide synthase domain TIGR01720/amino acid adenylation domain-containing protein n=1 Tax=Aquimarina spongiae TaxID=570521 RepID=A0A1M6LHP0_9FLAO|nr:non-ribosomal peptide synthetase [Aquimarina spongiae]SHJ70732.1 non-ribosomal peptide synthase domain TIGR01720/amino acid adenylation domain-containing protein [Aquimarina spongiae]
MENSTLINILKTRSNLKDKGIVFIVNGATEDFLSYHELYHGAIEVLSYLQQEGLKPKEELVFQIEDNKTFIIVFWACILGGIIPVPVTIGQKDDHRLKLFSIWKVLNKPHIIGSTKQLQQLEKFANNNHYEEVLEEIQSSFVEVEKTLEHKGSGDIYPVVEDDIAFIQFSSGSTGIPKGVVLTHKNLITNVTDISNAAKYEDSDSMISWMPLTHDMGMIGFHINPLFKGMNQYIMPTNLFVRRPGLWLEKASEHKVTILCSPNFGYSYVLKHCSNTEEYQWDLSNVRVIYNGAEPISEKIANEFISYGSVFGLNPNAMCPVYGLAEASLAVTMSDINQDVISCTVKRDKLGFGAEVEITNAGKESVSFVNVGKSIDHCAVRITNDDNETLNEQFIGHIQIQGNNVTSGYYNNKTATEEAISNTWLKTGDLGFMYNDCLYITGRAKDVFFINGQNYYSHDIENATLDIDGIELNKIVVTGHFNPDLQKEEVIAFVFFRGKIEKFIPLLQEIRTKVNLDFGFEIDHILPVRDIPRTTSGKLQRYKLLTQFKEGTFNELIAQINAVTNQIKEEKGKVFIPKSEEEEIVLSAWRKVLNKETIAIDDKFFEIGGTSLRAAELEMILNKELGVNLPLEQLYNKQTIGELLSVIDQLETSFYEDIPGISNDQEYHPLSAAQKRLYFSWAMDHNSIGYNLPFAIQIQGKIDEEKLSDSLHKLIERHDSLRMSFELDVEPKFYIHESIDFELGIVETNGEELENQIQSLVQPFNLSRPPLFRAQLVKTGKEYQVLFLDFHHIIFDGISVDNFLTELFSLYRDISLPNLDANYVDFVHWERNKHKGADFQLHKNYWETELSGDLPLLEMPLDDQRPAIFETTGKRLAFTLDNTISTRLKGLAQEKGCTLHSLLFSMYSVLLSKYTGQNDLIIGIPVGGRRHPSLQSLQGMFVNNLPIRVQIEEGIKFTELVELVKHRIISAIDHQDYPFEKMVQSQKGVRDVSRNPIFDTMFLYQDTDITRLGFDGVKISNYDFDPGFSKFDLSLEVFNGEDEISFALEYSSKLFSEEKMVQFNNHFRLLVNQIVQRPELRLEELATITAKEYADQIVKFNATEKNLPEKETIHELFEEEVTKHPHRIAMAFGENQLSFVELNEKANSLALRLKELVDQPKATVAIIMEKSPEFVISVLAVLKLGGNFVPITPDLPQDRIAYILDDSQSQLIVTSTNYQSMVSEIAGTSKDVKSAVVCVDNDSLDRTTDNLNVTGNSKDLAYIIYTSGTTGNPKGVMIEHGSLINYIDWASKSYVKGEQLAFPLHTSISFDLTITSIFTPLVSGNKIVIYHNNDQEVLIEKILKENKVDIIKLTPSHLRLITKLDTSDIIDKGCQVKRMIVGGEKLDTALVKEIRGIFGDNLEIYNEYGPTEATVGCMIYEFNEKDNFLTVPIGKPIANTQIYILDKHLKPVPVGVHGEVFVAGNGLARGYINNPLMNKEKFIENPFSEGQRMYRTGDLAKFVDSGVIEYVGRIDEQIKINGYRIEPEEIKNQILLHEGIETCIITTFKNNNTQPLLCAYVKHNENYNESIDEISLRVYLAEKLPFYMIPSHFITINKIPLTSNGKVDYNALPSPLLKKEKNTDENERLNEVEKTSISIWQEILEEEHISVRDNFFELGGDSIKAVQIASRLNEADIHLKVKDILTFQTIEQIILQSELQNNSYTQGVIEGQRDLFPIDNWFFSHDFNNKNYFNQSVLLKLRKDIPITKLEEAFSALIQAHDGLRQNYNPENGLMFYNANLLSQDFKLEVLNISDSGNEHLKNACLNFKNGFNITDGFLIKAAIIKQKGKANQLLVTAHHLLVDGVSWRILLNDLFQILSKGKDNAFLQKTASLIDWNEALKTYFTSKNRALVDEYWKNQVDEKFRIPLDFDIENWEMAQVDKVKGRLSAEQTLFLNKDAHDAYRSDNFTILLLAFTFALRDWTGDTSFSLELENHGRNLNEIDVSRTIGWFTCLYPQKVEINDAEIGSNIKRIKEQIKRIPDHGMEYGIYNYGDHQKYLEGSSISEIRFNYLGHFGNELNNDFFVYEDVDIGSEIDPQNKFTTKLEINLMIVDDHLEVEFIYNQNAHKPSTIEYIRDQFFINLETILDHIKAEKQVHFTPSDFEAAKLDQEDLEALFE